MLCGNCTSKIGEFDNFCKYCGQLAHIAGKYVQRWKGKEDNFNQYGSNSSDFEHLKQSLLQKYQGMALEDVFEGRQIETDMGNCYLIESSRDLSIIKIDKKKAAERLLSDLKLIYGIGEITEKKLKSLGYSSIKKLIDHPRYKKQAEQFIYFLENVDQQNLMGWVCRWFSKSHPHIFCLSSFNRQSDFLILDIETLGLSNTPIVLIGLAKIDNGTVSIKQYLARNYDEEAALLISLKRHIGLETVFITFNGAMFDLPFIRQRYYYYRLRPDLERIHFDVLHFSRNMLKNRFKKYNLYSLEKNLLKINRDMDIPGFMVPDFYAQYIEQENIGTLVPLIQHNRQDLLSLAQVFSRLHLEWEKLNN